MTFTIVGKYGRLRRNDCPDTRVVLGEFVDVALDSLIEDQRERRHLMRLAADVGDAFGKSDRGVHVGAIG